MKSKIVRYAPLLILLAVCGCNSKKQATEQKPAIRRVPVVRVAERPLNASINLPAELAPFEEVALYPRVPGYLEWIGVDRGSFVKKGQMLIRLSAPELKAQRAQAQSQLQATQAALLVAKAKLASDQGTDAHLRAAAQTPGIIAGNDLLVSAQTVKSDQANVTAAERNVQAAEEALKANTQMSDYLEVRAPFDGMVTERNVHPGALVGPAVDSAKAVPMIRIQMIDHLRLIIPVPQADVAEVPARQTVTFTVPAFPSQTFSGTLTRNSHAIDQSTRTMPVELDVKNLDRKLTPGTYAQVHWPIHRSRPSLFVPKTAVTSNQERTFVIRVADGKAEWVDVRTGTNEGDQVEVMGQLHAGDRVVLRASDEIQHGASIQAEE